tara:strand:- start:25 stop:270 length:246 start_codon:yes stop_codon:yes gene_type:complete
MPVRHKKQKSGKVFVEGCSFTVSEDGTLVPEPSPSQAKTLLKFDSLFERLGENSKSDTKKKSDTKPATKAAPKRAAKRGNK